MPDARPVPLADLGLNGGLPLVYSRVRYQHHDQVVELKCSLLPIAKLGFPKVADNVDNMDDHNNSQGEGAGMTSADDPASNSQQSPEEHLIYLAKRVIHLCNARLYNDPFFQNHVSPVIHTDLNGVITRGLASFINNYKISADASPNFYTEMFNESAM